jgi:hypothetical protein
LSAPAKAGPVVPVAPPRIQLQAAGYLHPLGAGAVVVVTLTAEHPNPEAVMSAIAQVIEKLRPQTAPSVVVAPPGVKL